MVQKSSTHQVVFLILFIVLFNNVICQSENYETAGNLRNSIANFTEFADNYGYKAEEHSVETDDGYILSLFRIPKGRNCLGPVRRPPVLLMHGLLESSDSFLDAGPSAGLAFLISDACYDLWVGNIRGNNYGKKHVRLNPDRDAKFWEFSAQEMGTFDLPAIIDYILNITQSTQLNYIGFSQGGKIFHIMCSEASGYCEKIKSAITLAPAARLKYSTSITFRLLIGLYAGIEPYLSTPRELDVLPKGGLVQKFALYTCSNSIAAATVCNAALISISSSPVSIQTTKVLFGHFPAGTSARNLAQFGQHPEGFYKYDYGPKRNKELYGSVEPATYNLSRTTVPTVIIYGRGDTCVNPRDVKWLADQLPNVVELYEVKDPTWAHLDNCYSQSIKQLIFPKIDQYLKRYSKS